MLTILVLKRIFFKIKIGNYDSSSAGTWPLSINNAIHFFGDWKFDYFHPRRVLRRRLRTRDGAKNVDKLAQFHFAQLTDGKVLQDRRIVS